MCNLYIARMLLDHDGVTDFFFYWCLYVLKSVKVIAIKGPEKHILFDFWSVNYNEILSL